MAVFLLHMGGGKVDAQPFAKYFSQVEHFNFKKNMEETATISMTRFKELELIEKIYNEKAISYHPYGYWGTLKILSKDETIKLMQDEVRYYREKLDKVPKWIKFFYPNSFY